MPSPAQQIFHSSCRPALNAQWIAEEVAVASTREAAEQITLAAARMERLLKDLLDVARFESRTSG